MQRDYIFCRHPCLERHVLLKITGEYIRKRENSFKQQRGSGGKGKTCTGRTAPHRSAVKPFNLTNVSAMQ